MSYYDDRPLNSSERFHYNMLRRERDSFRKLNTTSTSTTQSDVEVAKIKYEKAMSSQRKASALWVLGVLTLFATFAFGYNPLIALSLPMLVAALTLTITAADNGGAFDLKCEWIKLRDKYVDEVIRSAG